MDDQRKKTEAPLVHPAPQSTTSLPSTMNGTLRLDAGVISKLFSPQSYRGSLLVIAGTPADIGTHLVIEKLVTIGREPQGLQLNDGGISRAHAQVEQRGHEFVIRDLGSTNGTSVNGQRLEGERTLQEGDKIVLSQTVIKFTLVDETEAGYLKQVEHLVGTDDLTGLMSKHRFDASLKEAIRVVCSSGSALTALMMDMDGLKAVNDRHGHHYGARTIGEVGRLIGRILEGKGKACRFGGDEFSAFILADLKTTLLIAEEIRHQVEALRVFAEHPQLGVTISIGVAERPAEITDPVALLHLADLALYRAKSKGKNTICT